ncbi:MAG: sugar phosphate isomerase/epimerase [Verrucomicrobiota bacterium]
MDQSLSRDLHDRRGFLTGTLALASGATLGSISSTNAAHHETSDEGKGEFKFGLNMSTIRGQELDAAEEIEVAGKAGYDAIEPWFRRINEYVEAGGKLTDLKKRIDDHGMTVDSAIGFATWIVNDPKARAAGLEEARRDMDTIAQIGGTRIAAPPAGAKKDEVIELEAAAERYHALLELGKVMGVTPQIEMWGGHHTIGTVEKAIAIAIAAGHPDACFLGDVYHTYKGGSSFDSLRLLSANALQTYHFNDYPADPPRESIKDADRVFPGDGIAPIAEIVSHFRAVGASPVLNLELFNREYWEMDALECAKTGLAKMKAAVEGA